MTIKQTAAELRRTFKGHTVALVAPVRTYDDDTWSVMVFSGHPDQPKGAKLSKIDLGTIAGDPPPIAAMMDVVIHARRPGDLTRSEANAATDQLTAELIMALETVESFPTELAMARRAGELFPGKRTAELLQNVIDDPSEGDMEATADDR
jgi:hypothetical protein